MKFLSFLFYKREVKAVVKSFKRSVLDWDSFAIFLTFGRVFDRKWGARTMKEDSILGTRRRLRSKRREADMIVWGVDNEIESTTLKATDKERTAQEVEIEEEKVDIMLESIPRAETTR